VNARLGLGTYRCRDTTAAARFAAEAGATLFDTAPNYGTHRALAPVLADHRQVAVSTKAGFPGDAADQAVRDGVLTRAQAAEGHAINPAYIRRQARRSRAELGRDLLNTLFLHNPERACAGNRARFFYTLTEAFEALESEVADGGIAGYGIATWHGFQDGVFTVADLLGLAHRAAGGAHHLTAIQLPVSLVDLGPIAQALDGCGPLVDADVAGLEVHVSAPLHGGALAHLTTPELAEHIAPGLTPTQACLHTVASLPQVTRVLLSASTPAHWHEAAAALALPPLPTAHLREITDVLTAA
jgi:aryl-alcohol dehydrogenase-like predicted oxidoreductase